jgi:hypothetical protein
MVAAAPYVAIGVVATGAVISETIGPAFWPAVISAIAAVAAVIIGVVNRHKIHEVHVAVNSRLDSALGDLSRAVVEIANLKRDVRYEQTQEPREVMPDAPLGHDHDDNQ